MINYWNWPILGHIEVSITMALFKSDWRLLLNLYGRYAIVDRCFLFVSPVLFGCFNAAYWYPTPWMMIFYHRRLFRIAKTAFAILDILWWMMMMFSKTWTKFSMWRYHYLDLWRYLPPRWDRIFILLFYSSCLMKSTPLLLKL